MNTSCEQTQSSTVEPDFRAAFHRARRAFRLRRVVEGVALTLAIGAVVVLTGIAIMSGARFATDVVEAVRGVAWLMIAIAVVVFVVLPLLRRVSHSSFARYIEQHHPQLDALLLSAVEADLGLVGAETSPQLAHAVRHSAARALNRPQVHDMERRRTWRAIAGVAAVSALVGIIAHFGPQPIRHGFAMLFSPNADPQASNPFSVIVEPGDIEVLEGEDLQITARGNGYTPSELTLEQRHDDDASWQSSPIAQSTAEGQFSHFVFDIAKPFTYRVSDGRVHSSEFRVAVIPKPSVERIDLRYQFPKRTGREDELVRDGGDIDAVKGTVVELHVLPRHRVSGGEIVVDGQTRVPLVLDGNALRGQLEIQHDGRYRIELDARGHGMTPASVEHAIIARQDQLPTVALASPGRDIKATAIEEIAIAADATDDVAVRTLELVLSVNGASEEIITLGADQARTTHIKGVAELALEDRKLQPGDLISYYVRARDAEGDGARQMSSDIYFIDVRPFDVTFRRGRGGGGGGGGRQQGGEQNLSAQQRSLVVALFKLSRDRDVLDEQVVSERVKTLTSAQARIRTRTDAIVRRLGTRSIVNLNPGYRRMAKELPQASKAMSEVEALLALGDLSPALPAARTALLHLQRADAAVREVQVAQQQRGGAGAQSSAANDLSNLFRLEMDRFRNQYESVRRGNWQSESQPLDETLEKLKELAERQLQELERSRALAGQGTSGDAQAALAEEVDKLLRELARLTRKRPDEALRQSMQALEDAARAMRRSANAGDQRAGEKALEQLRQARRHLDGAGRDRLARDTEQAHERAQALAEAQSRIEAQVRGAAEGQSTARDGAAPPNSQGQSSASGSTAGNEVGGGQTASADTSRSSTANGGRRADGARPQAGSTSSGERRNANERDDASVGPLVAAKESLADELQALHSRLEQLADKAREQGQPGAAKALSDAARGIRADDTEERIRLSAERIKRDPSATNEQEEARIARALEALRERLGVATGAIGEPRSARLARDLETLKGTLRGADRTREQIDQARRERLLSGDGGRGTGTGGGSRSDGVDLDTIRRAMESRAGEIISMAESIARHQPQMKGELQGLLDALHAVRGDEASNVEELAKRHTALMSKLQAIERELRRELDRDPPAAAAVARAEAPLQHRDIAQQYYRRLSEK